MSGENEVVIEQSAAEIAAEESAFAAAFNEGRGEPVDPEPEPEPAVNEPATEPPPGEPTVDVKKAEPVVEQAPAQNRLIAGLTEEQVASALARAGNLQTTVDKMAGRIGQLMQQIEQLRSAPASTPAQQQALDIKLDKLSAAFPELAGLLKEDLQSLQPGAPAQTPVQVAPGITQAELDEILKKQLGATAESTREMIELKVLSVAHPDWEEVIRTPEFALFRDNVLPQGVGEQLMNSEDSTFISKHLTGFKAWRDQSRAAPVDAQVQQVQQVQQSNSRAKRLANAVLPAGSAALPANTAVTEDDAFVAGFKGEQRRSGRA